jgi:hypothetical protein
VIHLAGFAPADPLAAENLLRLTEDRRREQASEWLSFVRSQLPSTNEQASIEQAICMGVEPMNRLIPWAATVALSAFAVGSCVPPGEPTAVFASIDLSCGGKTYTVGTGTNKGECQSSGQNAVCGDGRGNAAEVSCASGCIKTSGAGSCSIKALPIN